MLMVYGYQTLVEVVYGTMRKNFSMGKLNANCERYFKKSFPLCKYFSSIWEKPISVKSCFLFKAKVLLSPHNLTLSGHQCCLLVPAWCTQTDWIYFDVLYCTYLFWKNANFRCVEITNCKFIFLPNLECS